MQEKIRVYALARELNVESKDLVDICRQAGIDIKNQLSSLDPDQRDMVVQLVKRGGGGTAVAAPPKPVVPPQLPSIQNRVRVLDQRPVRRDVEPARSPAATPAAESPWDPLESTCRHASLSIL